MSSLSTHVLDTMHGRPAAGIAVRLLFGDQLLFEGEADADGRCKSLPVVGAGRYRLAFAVAAYFSAAGVALPDPPFLDEVVIDFGMAEDRDHYHVPLLVSPFAYSTYSGS